MHSALIVSAFVVAIAAAARSTWSPCGLSMLSSITPLGESGRGHRFGSTAAWFVAGAAAGGASLGTVMLTGAWMVSAAGVPERGLAVAAAVACGLAAAADANVLGFQMPLLRRQVNELWLDQFRHWVYAAGFGWQIGVGFSTYIMTAAVIALVPVAVATGSPWLALSAGVTFGTLRGLTVLLGAHVTSVAALQHAHRRLDHLRRPVQVAVAVAMAAVAVAIGTWAWWPAPAAVAGVVAAACLLRGRRGRVVRDDQALARVEG